MGITTEQLLPSSLRQELFCFRGIISSMTRGTKPKPALAVVREGNPGHRPVRESMALPPNEPEEPKWGRGGLGLEPEVIKDASYHWRLIAPALARAAGLTREMQFALEEYCIVVARIRQGERAISKEGMVVEGAQGGMVRNPWSVALNQYRAQYGKLIGELGLSPSAATRIPPKGGTRGDDDPFDS